MTALAHAHAKSRSRIARVRRMQHLQAVGEAAAAEGKLIQLEGSATRLTALRDSLAANHGNTDGATLGSIAELQMRLDQARHGLAQAIGQARDTVALRTAERQDAHVARESAERLQVRAVAAMHRQIEERMAAAIRPRAPRSHG